MSQREELRRLSAGVFGNRYRAELLAALAAAGTRGVCLGDLALAQQVAASVYVPPVRALIALGLVEQLPAAPGQRRRFYRCCGSPRTWRALAGAVERLAGETSPQRVA